ncbi:DUF5313 domain-containing protein [Gordonia sp. TBRC 11910]|uniref:DUF5313 domain-containing protein n=1 Tax=Gordonia asplenii TaxID=2725283 RepID=A0A848L716_9ACTN|nr:DUF5313 family protein [Gordonia asplenii]NMO04795.1 DUF5313 domain-containing protein [Gordonia asplenii]
MSDPTRPNPWQYITYCYGRTLPASMHDWVRNDLAGPGAARRTVIRNVIPVLILLVILLLCFPNATPLVQLTMTLPILLPFIYFAVVLNKFYRKARLKRHGLDTELVHEIELAKTADARAEYEARHGRRLQK